MNFCTDNSYFSDYRYLAAVNCTELYLHSQRNWVNRINRMAKPTKSKFCAIEIRAHNNDKNQQKINARTQEYEFEKKKKKKRHMWNTIIFNSNEISPTAFCMQNMTSITATTASTATMSPTFKHMHNCAKLQFMITHRVLRAAKVLNHILITLININQKCVLYSWHFPAPRSSLFRLLFAVCHCRSYFDINCW